jgi:hypothetical protein
MLFETQSKADRFIELNGDSIREKKGKAPVKSYFCNFCGGYHVTSSKSKTKENYFKWHNREIIGRIKEYDLSPSVVKSKIIKIIKTLNGLSKLMYMGKIDEVEIVVDSCIKDLDNVCKYSLQGYGKREEALAKTKYYKDAITYIRKAINTPKEEQMDIIDLIVDNGTRSFVKTVVINIITFREIEEQMAENELYVKACDRDKLRWGIKRCKSLKNKLKGVEHKDKLINSAIERLLAEINIVTWEKSELRNLNK